MSSSKNIRVLVTTGDADGIGWEVTAKALNSIGPKVGVQFVVYRSTRALKVKPMLGKKFRKVVVKDLAAAVNHPFDHRTAIEVHSAKSPAQWVEEAAQACLLHRFQALVTAPLSKTEIIASGMQDIGHTEILSRVTSVRDLFMGFIGQKFCVVLATGHRPLRGVVAELSVSKLTRAITAARQLRSTLSESRQKLPLALVGVNPHAGEGGLIGSEEGWMRALAKDDVHGPLVPDSAFLPKNWKTYSVYICPYHDQGLIPFKMVHGFNGGVHLTLGLPFVRTSVDHGTAKDLFGKNKAEAGSMKDALLTAVRLSKELR